MIFYQTRSHTHRTVNLPNDHCTQCNNRGTLKMYVLQKYTWLFGPIFPGNKYAIIACESCKEKIPNSAWNKDWDAIYHKETKALRTPFRMWRGTIVIGVFYLTVFSLVKLEVLKSVKKTEIPQSKTELKPDCKNFKVGDVLFISTDKTNKNYASLYDFTLVKVMQIDGDKTILKKYTDLFDSQDKNTLSLSAIDNSKFKEEIVVKTKFLREDESLVYYTKQEGMLENKVFGSALTIIK